MAKLLYSAAASLDGFIAGPGGDMSWLSDFVGTPNPTADRLLAQVGALLCGGGTLRGGDPNAGTEAEGAFGGEYHGPTFVLTRRPPAEPLPGVEFVTDLTDAVERAKVAADERYVNVLGANLAKSCLEHGLLDEVLMLFVPVLLGDGVRMFDHPGGTRVRLAPLAGESAHWYRVVR